MPPDEDGDLRALIAPRLPKILTFDLERIPGRVELDIWEGRDAKRISYLHPDRWTELPSTLCGAAKWWGRKRVQFVAAWDNPDDPQHVARTFWRWIDDADIIVTYNGKRADEKWLRNDWLIAGLPQPATYKHVDLYATIRNKFGFESNSLSHISARLGLSGKDGRYNADEARLAASGNRRAQRDLRRYNSADVTGTEELYDYLGPWLDHPHIGLWTGKERSCWRCGGEELTRIGRTMTAVTAYALYRCANPKCGALSRNNNRLGNVTQRVSR